MSWEKKIKIWKRGQNEVKKQIIKEDRQDRLAELEALLPKNKFFRLKTLEKYNEEMIELRKVNQDLLNTVIEAQKVIKNVLEGKKWKMIN